MCRGTCHGRVLFKSSRPLYFCLRLSFSSLVLSPCYLRRPGRRCRFLGAALRPLLPQARQSLLLHRGPPLSRRPSPAATGLSPRVSRSLSLAPSPHPPRASRRRAQLPAPGFPRRAARRRAGPGPPPRPSRTGGGAVTRGAGAGRRCVTLRRPPAAPAFCAGGGSVGRRPRKARRFPCGDAQLGPARSAGPTRPCGWARPPPHPCSSKDPAAAGGGWGRGPPWRGRPERRGLGTRALGPRQGEGSLGAGGRGARVG